MQGRRKDQEYAEFRKLIVFKEYLDIMSHYPDAQHLSVSRIYEMASLNLMSPDRASRVIKECRKQGLNRSNIDVEIDEVTQRIKKHSQPMRSYQVTFDDGERITLKNFCSQDAKSIAEIKKRKKVVDIDMV